MPITKPIKAIPKPNPKANHHPVSKSTSRNLRRSKYNKSSRPAQHAKAPLTPFLEVSSSLNPLINDPTSTNLSAPL